MRAQVVRELVVIARRPALVVAVVVHGLLLAGFISAWQDGVPLAGGADFSEQFRALQWGWLAICLPWVAARCVAVNRGDNLVMTAALTASRPSTIATAKVLALSLVLSLFALTGLPFAIIARKIAAVPAAGALSDLAALGGLAVLVSAATVAWVTVVSGRLRSWIGASGSVAAVVGLAWHWRPAGLDVGLVCGLVGLASVAWLARWSDQSLRYLSERTT